MTDLNYNMVNGERSVAVSQQQAEDAFVAAVRMASVREPVFVVTGPDERKAFVDRIRQLDVDVIVDSDLPDVALILAGDTSEWFEELRDAVIGIAKGPR